MLVNIRGSFITEGAVLYRYIIDPGGRSIPVHYCPRQLSTGIILPPGRNQGRQLYTATPGRYDMGSVG